MNRQSLFVIQEYYEDDEDDFMYNRATPQRRQPTRNAPANDEAERKRKMKQLLLIGGGAVATGLAGRHVYKTYQHNKKVAPIMKHRDENIQQRDDVLAKRAVREKAMKRKGLNMAQRALARTTNKGFRDLTTQERNAQMRASSAQIRIDAEGGGRKKYFGLVGKGDPNRIKKNQKAPLLSVGGEKTYTPKSLLTRKPTKFTKWLGIGRKRFTTESFIQELKLTKKRDESQVEAEIRRRYLLRQARIELEKNLLAGKK